MVRKWRNQGYLRWLEFIRFWNNFNKDEFVYGWWWEEVLLGKKDFISNESNLWISEA